MAKKPKPFAVADCETTPFLFGREPKPLFWEYYDGVNCEVFERTEDFVRYIYDKEVVLYAHNGGKFDWHFILDYIEPGSEIMLINGRIAKLKFGKCELRDSYNILPVPLAAYQKEKFDYSLLEEDKAFIPHNKKLILEYLHSDCIHLFNLVSAYREKHGVVLTQAGAAMRLWQKITGIEPPRSTQDFFDKMSPFYYGGRVQCFDRGLKEENFQVFDINSAYPWAMLDKHPFSVSPIRRRDVDESYAFEKPQAFFCVQAISKGALPWREERKSKLLFPNDNRKREYLVTGWELAAALRNNALTFCKVMYCYDFEELIDFQDYVLPLFAEKAACKEAGDIAGELLAKLDLNTLYGKWGSDSTRYQRYKIFDLPQRAALMLGGVQEGHKSFLYSGMIGPNPLGARDLYENEMRFYNVATAASITGKVRAFLYESLCKVERPLYCDTDSIACVNGDALSQGKELGQWKHEGDFVKWALAGRKLYAFTTEEGRGKTFDLKTLAENKANGVPMWGKIASKGVMANNLQIEIAATGKSVKIRKDAPNFSVKHSGAKFIERKITLT